MLDFKGELSLADCPPKIKLELGKRKTKNQERDSPTEVITEVLGTERKPINLDNGLVTEPFACDNSASTAREDFVPESIIKEKALDEQPLYNKKRTKIIYENFRKLLSIFCN